MIEGYYTYDNIIEKCSKAINTPETFYSQGFVNYRSRTTDNNRLCTELIAEFLLEEKNFNMLNGIKMQSRTEAGKKYNMKHKGEYPAVIDHDNEKIIAIDLFNQCTKLGSFDYIGEIIDYQTPLKTKRKDAYGEIDLVSANEDEKAVYLLELKKKDAMPPETMLRCILEVFTYYKIVDRGNLLKEFGKEGYKIKISPLVFIGDEQYNEWVDMNKGNRPKLKELMQRLETVPFFLCRQDTNNRYIVVNE